MPTTVHVHHEHTKIATPPPARLTRGLDLSMSLLYLSKMHLPYSPKEPDAD